MTSSPNPYQPTAAAGGTRTLSLIGMIAGIVALVFSWIPILGIVLGIGAVVLGHLGQRRERPAKAFWITALITGYLALLASIVFIVINAIAVAAILQDAGY